MVPELDPEIRTAKKPGQGCSVERQICEEGDDEILSLIDRDGLALCTVGQLRNGTYYAFDQDCQMIAESRDLDVVLKALDAPWWA